jgi:hypothetical protein
MNTPAPSRVGNGGCPGPTRHTETEASRQKIPVDLPRKPHQRMAQVDDLLERRAKQVVLAIVARLAHRSPPTANLVVEGITDRQALSPASTLLYRHYHAQQRAKNLTGIRAKAAPLSEGFAQTSLLGDVIHHMPALNQARCANIRDAGVGNSLI